MNTHQNTANFDSKVRLHIYEHFIKTSQAPTIIETADALGNTSSEIKVAYRRLADHRMLVLKKENDEILMAEPFSAVPTNFQVEAGRRSWWANCIWDALGIPPMLKEDARIIASCGDCNEPMFLTIKDGSLMETRGVAHILVPAKYWWDDIVFT